MSKPIPASDLDVSLVSFVPGPAKTGRNPSSNLKYNGSQQLNILVKATIPGGIMVRENENGVSYSLMPSLAGCDPMGVAPGPDTELGAFYNFLSKLKDKLVDTAVEESPKWFGKQRSQIGVSENLNPLLNLSSDKSDGRGPRVPNGKYPPSWKVKVPVYDGRVNTEIIDSKKVGVYTTVENIQSVFPKGVVVDMHLSGTVYILAGGGFGLTWRLQKAQVFPPARVTAADIFSRNVEPANEENPRQVEDSAPEEEVGDVPVAPVVAAPATQRRRKVVALAGGSE